MNGNAPNAPSDGFHSLEIIKSSPNARIVGRELLAIIAIIEMTTMMIRAAAINRIDRKMRSPVVLVCFTSPRLAWRCYGRSGVPPLDINFNLLSTLATISGGSGA